MTRNPLGRRILGAFLGNAFARAMRIVEQICLVPLLLSAWGIDRFGEWVALTAIATFAGLASLGIGHSAYSDIVIQSAKADRDAAARSFATAIVLITAIDLVGTALLAVFALTFDIRALFSLQTFSSTEAAWILLIVGLSVFVGFYIEPLSGAVGAARGAGISNFVAGVSKVVEIAAIAVALTVSASPIFIAAIILASVVLNAVVNLVLTARLAPWLPFHFGAADYETIRRTWKPALGFFCIFVCFNIINVQVPRLIVFHGFGAASLSIFAIYVTYTRAARNLACMIPQSSQVEIGRLFAEGKADRTRRLVETVAVAALGLGFALLVGALVAAPVVIPIWTHSSLSVPWDVLAALTLVALVGTYFDPMLIAAGAMNEMGRVASFYALGIAIGISAAILLMPVAGIAVVAGVCMLPPELAGALAATRTVESLIGRLHLSAGIGRLRGLLPR